MKKLNLIIAAFLFSTSCLPIAIAQSSDVHEAEKSDKTLERSVEESSAYKAVTKRQKDPGLITGKRVLRTIFATLFVCCLAVVILGKMLPKFLKREPGLSGVVGGISEETIEILNRTRLTRDSELVMLRVGGETKLLIGVSSNGISLVTKLPDIVALEGGQLPESDNIVDKI